MPYYFVIIAVLIIANFYILFRRNKNGRNVGKDATAQRMASVKHHDDLVRKLDHEQQNAAKRVEMRNKTFELYEQVRRDAEAYEQAHGNPESDEQHEK